MKMFGQAPKTGLLDLNLPEDRLAFVETEEQLQALFARRYQQKTQDGYCSRQRISSHSHIPTEEGEETRRI
jgi:hypothetical protein